MPPNLVILRFYRIFAAEIKEIQNERIQKRIADKLLEYRLEEVGAVLIEGPKWCGKLPQQNKRPKACYIWQIQTTKTTIWKWQI